jgi:hypothetical protein
MNTYLISISAFKRLDRFDLKIHKDDHQEWCGSLSIGTLTNTKKLLVINVTLILNLEFKSR